MFLGKTLYSHSASLHSGGTGKLLGKANKLQGSDLITISTAIRIKNTKNFGSYIRAIFDISCYYDFNLCGIFEKMMSFSPILTKTWNKGN